MSADPTTTGLVANVRRRGFLPTGSGLSTLDLLQYATEQLRNYIPAFLKGLREEYLISTLSIAITGPTIPAPARAVGAALRWLKWRQPDGRLLPVVRTEPERTGDYETSGNTPQAYYFEGNNIVLVPPVTSGTLVLGYQQRPGQLVLPSDCGLITGINTGTNTLTFAALPSTFTNALTYDCVSASGNFVALSLGVAAPTVTPTSMVLAALPASLAVGDYVCMAGETCIPQMPVELHDLLAQATAAEIANATGSTRAASINAALEQLRAQLGIILSPRNDGSARVIINRSSIGRRFF